MPVNKNLKKTIEKNKEEIAPRLTALLSEHGLEAERKIYDLLPYEVNRRQAVEMAFFVLVQVLQAKETINIKDINFKGL
jgi:hypothetical protein